MEGMFFFEVYESHIEFIHSNHFISEHALIHDFDNDRILLNYAFMLNRKFRVKTAKLMPMSGKMQKNLNEAYPVARLEEKVFFPNSLCVTSAGNIGFGL